LAVEEALETVTTSLALFIVLGVAIALVSRWALGERRRAASAAGRR